MNTDLAPALLKAIETAQAAAEAGNRITSIEVDARGTKISVPLMLTQQGNGITIAVLDEALDLANAEADRVNPLRKGGYSFDDLQSLLLWASKYKQPDTAAFVSSPTVDGSDGEIVVVVDELPAPGEGAKGTNRSLHASVDIGLSDALKAWIANAGRWHSVDVFHGFVDYHSDELGTADLISFVNNIEIEEKSTYKRSVDPGTGNVKLAAENQSGPAVKVPRSFTFHVPVFDYDDDMNGKMFTARLSMKIEKGRPIFSYTITDLKRRLSEAVQVMKSDIAKVVPVVYSGTKP